MRFDPTFWRFQLIRAQKYLLVETNFRVYAETSSELQIRLLSIFSKMVL
jgi:hypothetical protein